MTTPLRVLGRRQSDATIWLMTAGALVLLLFWSWEITSSPEVKNR